MQHTWQDRRQILVGTAVPGHVPDCSAAVPVHPVLGLVLSPAKLFVAVSATMLRIVGVVAGIVPLDVASELSAISFTRLLLQAA